MTSSVPLRRFMVLFGLPNLVFWAVALITPNPFEIVVLNLALAGLSIAVCVAYGQHIVTNVLTKPSLEGYDLVAVGIFYSFGSYTQRTLFSLTWRWLGEPQWMVNSELVGGFIFASIVAAALHLSAPYALNGQVPVGRWVRIGTWAGAAVIVGLLLLHWSDLADEVRRYTTPNDRAPPPVAEERNMR